MTKCDFELIAGVLRYEVDAAKHRKDTTSMVTLSRVAMYMSAKLHGTNPRFDTDKFLRACGVES